MVSIAKCPVGSSLTGHPLALSLAAKATSGSPAGLSVQLTNTAVGLADSGRAGKGSV